MNKVRNRNIIVHLHEGPIILTKNLDIISNLGTGQEAHSSESLNVLTINKAVKLLGRHHYICYFTMAPVTSSNQMTEILKPCTEHVGTGGILLLNTEKIGAIVVSSYYSIS